MVYITLTVEPKVSDNGLIVGDDVFEALKSARIGRTKEFIELLKEADNSMGQVKTGRISFGSVRFPHSGHVPYPIPETLYHAVGNRGDLPTQLVTSVLVEDPAKYVEKTLRIAEVGLIPGSVNMENFHIRTRTNKRLDPIYFSKNPDCYYGILNLTVPGEDIQQYPHFIYEERALNFPGAGYGVFAPKLHPNGIAVVDIPSSGKLNIFGNDDMATYYILELSQVCPINEEVVAKMGWKRKWNIFVNPSYEQTALSGIIIDGLNSHRQYADRLKEELTRRNVPFDVVPLDEARNIYRKTVDLWNNLFKDFS